MAMVVVHTDGLLTNQLFNFYQKSINIIIIYEQKTMTDTQLSSFNYKTRFFELTYSNTDCCFCGCNHKFGHLILHLYGWTRTIKRNITFPVKEQNDGGM
jgi:hypothetical protein